MAVLDPIAVFMKDHDEALMHLQRLKKASQEFRKNGFSERTFNQIIKASAFVDHDDEIALIELCEAVDEIVTLMVNHIHTENQILFPLVRKFITKKDLHEAAQKLL